MKSKNLSKSLSYWLRHNPSDINIEIQKDGWVDIDDLIKNINTRFKVTFDDIKNVVDNNDKKRFSFNSDTTKIRANQGHSIKVDIKYKEVIPPKYLYHGTPKKSSEIIIKNGLIKMNRHHVHLSPDIETAEKVGSRRGEFVLFQIEAMKLRADGHKIFISDNGVYLTDKVPPNYLKLL